MWRFAAVEMRWEDLGEGGGFGGSGSPDFRNVTGTDSAKHANLTKPLGITWDDMAFSRKNKVFKLLFCGPFHG